jgi:DNA-binding HxlR family transcriptional regulator
VAIKEAEKRLNAQVEKCEIANIWEVLGRRWALLILKNLNAKEAIRFNELKRLMAGISSTVLADRLLELEREGLISKKIYPEIPPKVEYRLTVQARELGVILKELGRWAQRRKAPGIPAATV